jgi:hypothetical protein
MDEMDQIEFGLHSFWACENCQDSDDYESEEEDSESIEPQI